MRIRSTAGRLASATGASLWRSLITTMATQCADCHADTGHPSRFIFPAEPGDEGSAPARMARQEWAAETIWIGLVGSARR